MISMVQFNTGVYLDVFSVAGFAATCDHLFGLDVARYA